MKRAIVAALLCACAFAVSAQTPATISSSSPLPVTLAAPAAAVDGSTSVGTTAITLFGGATPAHGFQIFLQSSGSVEFSDAGTAGGLGSTSMMLGPIAGGLIVYTTPAGYTPVGPVSIVSTSGTQYVAARSW